MEQLANSNLISPAKINSADLQVSVSQGPHWADNVSGMQNDGHLDNSDPIDQANQLPPSHWSVMESIERDDTPMHDAGLINQTGAGSSSSGHERPS
jgi:hypothetical protein